MFKDRILFADTPTNLLLALQAAGLIALINGQFKPLDGVALYSHIGDAYQDGMDYALITLDDTLVDVTAIDAQLAANIDPTRTPLRIRLGSLITDPDEQARVKWLIKHREQLELAFQRFKATAGTPTVTRSQLRTAAQTLGRLTQLDNYIAGLADSAWKVRWQENGLFTRADLNAAPLTSNQLDALFSAAQEA